MLCNVGTTEKIIRVIIAVAIGIIAYVYSIWWLYIVAAIPLITAIISYCPINHLFGINTCKR